MLPARAEQRRLQPRAGGRAAGGDGGDRAGPGHGAAADALLPQPHPLRRAPRLRPARCDLRRPRARRRRRSRSRSPPPATVAAALGERRGATSLDIDSRRAGVPLRRRGNVVAAHRLEQTEAHRLIERLMILTNEQVAERLERERVPAIYRVHAAARPDPDRTPDRAAGGARRADAAAGPGLVRPAGGRGRGRGQPPGRGARPRGADTAATRIPPSCSAPSSRPLQRAQQRPRRPRQRRLHALHLADPPLPRPGRAPGAAGGAGGGGGGAAARRGARGRRRLLGPRARVGEDRARRRRRLRRLPARARAGRARA